MLACRYEQFKGLNSNDVSKFRQHINRGAIHSPFQQTYISSLDISIVRKFFLRKACGLSVFFQVLCKNCADIHPSMEATPSDI